MNSDSDEENSMFASEKSYQPQEMNIYATSNKCVHLEIDEGEAYVGSAYRPVSEIDLGVRTHQNICQIYQRKTDSHEKVKFSGSGIIVQTLLESEVRLLFDGSSYFIIGLVLSCAHLLLNLQKDIYMTNEKTIPDVDHFKLIPLFKQDYTTRVDTFEDPLTEAKVTANDVNLFLLLTYSKARTVAKDLLGRVKPRLPIMKKEDIKEEMEVYLGAFSARPEGKDETQGRALYLMSPALNRKYIKAKKKWLKNPKDEGSKTLVLSFQKIVKWSQVFREDKCLYKGKITQTNGQMAAATYSCYEGSSGGPILHSDGTNDFIVGVNHGSAAVADYSYQKIKQLKEKNIMIPRDFEFNLNAISEPIHEYVKEIDEFYKLQGAEEKDQVSQVQSSSNKSQNNRNKVKSTWVAMRDTLKVLFRHFETIINYLTCETAQFKKTAYGQFNLIFGASSKQSNHSLFTFGGERFEMIRKICQNFEQYISSLGDKADITLRKLLEQFGNHKEFLSEKSFKAPTNFPKLEMSTQFEQFLPHEKEEMLKCIIFKGRRVKRKSILKLKFQKLQGMLKKNLEVMNRCALIEKLKDIFSEKKSQKSRANYIESDLIGIIKSILEQEQIGDDEAFKSQDPEKEEIKQEIKEQSKEEKSKLSEEVEQLKKEKAKLGTLNENEEVILKRLFQEAAKSMMRRLLRTKVKYYEDNVEVMDLLGLLVDIDIPNLHLQDQKTKIKILSEVNAILKREEERGGEDALLKRVQESSIGKKTGVKSTLLGKRSKPSKSSGKTVGAVEDKAKKVKKTG